jgi:hypothetical protein
MFFCKYFLCSPKFRTVTTLSRTLHILHFYRWRIFSTTKYAEDNMAEDFT